MAKSLSAALSDVRLCGHVSGFAVQLGHFLQRQRRVTICALVQSALGLNVVSPVPLALSTSLRPVSYTHLTLPTT